MADLVCRPAIVLVQPEIPGNTGTIGRTCVALDIDLVLIKPYGFELTDKSVRRAGLDYWKHVALREYDTWSAYVQVENPARQDLFFFEEFGATSAYEAPISDAPVLVFGRETKGLPQEIIQEYHDRMFHLPMRSQHIRSLNLANAATAAAYLMLRHII